MHRWPVLSDFIGFELLEVAYAMADGSYWDEGPPFGGDNFGNERDPSAWG